MDPILIGLLIYFIVILFVGLFTYRYMKTLSDFLLGGRRLGPWVIAISERASGESAWFLLGLPGMAYAMGFSVFWTVIGCAVGIFLSWSLIAERLRAETEELNALTIPDYLETRHRDNSHIIRIVSLLIILLFYTFYVSAQFIGAGKILYATFGLSEKWGILIGAGIVVFYTLMGGFLAVAWTDLFQGLLMAVVSIILPFVGIVYLGGWTNFLDKIGSFGPQLLDIGGGKTGHSLILGLAIGSLGIGLGYMGQPHLLVRYMAIREKKDIRKGRLIAMSWVLFAYWGAAFIGIVGLGILGGGLTDPEKVMPLLAKALMPGWIAGLIISGAIAAMMSTADSQLLVVTSAVAEDSYRRLIRADASQNTLVFLSRVSTVIIAIIAFILAIIAKQLIFWLVLYAWAGLGASFGPAILLSLWWRKTTRQGILTGLISGTVTVIIWYNIPLLKGFLYELVPGFFVSLLGVYIVSLMTYNKGGR